MATILANASYQYLSRDTRESYDYPFSEIFTNI